MNAEVSYSDKDEFVYDFYERYQRLPSLVEIDQWKRESVDNRAV